MLIRPFSSASTTTSHAFSAVSIDPSLGVWSTKALLRLFLLLNIVLAFRPFIPYISKQDDILDIPLTPSQRALLGLPASPASTTGSPSSIAGPTSYITPPRYRRSSGSYSPSPLSIGSSPAAAMSDRRSVSATHASSPHSASRLNNSGYSPSPFSPFRSPLGIPGTNGSPSTSPLYNRGVSNVNDANTFGMTSTSGLARSQSLRERTSSRSLRDSLRESTISVSAETPSPPTRVKKTPGLNYKWLYEKGRHLPKSESMNF